MDPRRWTSLLRVVGTLALGALVLAVVLAVLNAAAKPSLMVPHSKGHFHRWFTGPLPRIAALSSVHRFAWLLIAMLVCYAVVLACARALPWRVAIAAIVAAHAIVFLGPVLLSGDVFGYIAYGRLGVLHHLDPYTHGTGAAPQDPVYPYFAFHVNRSPYGPLFTLLSYMLVPLRIAPALWAYKLLAVGAALGCVWLVWRVAQARGLDPVGPAVLVGLNPVWLLYALGGAHNDLLMTLLIVGSVALLVSGHERASAATAIAAAAIKPTALIVLPFLLLGAQRRLAAIASAALAGIAVVVMTAVAFPGHMGAIVQSVLRQAGHYVSAHSVPSELAGVLSVGNHSPTLQKIAFAVLVAALLFTFVAAYRGADWIAAAAAATLALLVTTRYLLPWYAALLLPLAALTRGRALPLAALAFSAFAIVMRWEAYL